MGSEASLSGLHHSIVVMSKTHMITVHFQRMCVRAKTQSCSICILFDPCVLHIISHALCSPATKSRSYSIQGSIHSLLAVSREMVLISCLDSVEGAKGMGELFSMGEFRMVNNGKSFGL